MSVIRERWRGMTVIGLAAVLIWTEQISAAPGVSLSGFLDADVWTDFRGNFYTNSELDLGTKISFDSAGKVSSNVYTTVLAGGVPAGSGEPGQRWVAVLFDGFDLTYKSKVGTFRVGDLVYQYGTFNYYFYKRKSMIVPESFTRGLKFTLELEKLSTSILAGAADIPDDLVSRNYVIQGASPGDTLLVTSMEQVAKEGNAADLGGSSTIKAGEAMEIGVFYGVRSDMKRGFRQSGTVYVGLELDATLVGEALGVKCDVGYRNLPGTERSHIVALLLEPTLNVGHFSLALSSYLAIDPAATGASLIGEDFFVYVEPGYRFSEQLTVGLPLEIHANGTVSDLGVNGAFWAVPTLYLTLFEGVQWWLWGQTVVPFAGGGLGYGLGSEVIVRF